LKMGAEVAAGAAAASVMERVAGAAKHAQRGAPPPRPNIVLILADDMGFSDIGCFGSDVATPHLDKLAAHGMRLRQFYNNPRCCPSRASILTGLYAHQVGMGMMTSDYKRYPYPAYAGTLSKQCVTAAEALKTAGYQTGAVGKWHLTALGADVGNENWPLQRGFDKFWGFLEGYSTYFKPQSLMQGNTPLPPVTDEDFYLTDKIAEHAVEYIEEFAGKKEPFFLYCAFNAAHWPIQAPEKLVKKYEERYKSGWDAVRAFRYNKQINEGLIDEHWPLTPRDQRVPAWEDAKDTAWEARRMAVYAAMIESLDTNVGRVVDAVERMGMTENTLIVFMSDNGGNAEEIKVVATDASGMRKGNNPKVMPGGADTFESIGIPWGNVANTPFRLYKHYAHEGGISTPLIAYWPKVIAATKKPVDALGHETDLMPTFLEVAGAQYPARNEAGALPALVGQSLMPVFEGKERERRPIFWEHEGNKAVRDGKWKLVSRFPEEWELFDMEKDRTELNDVSAQNADRVQRMKEMCDEWAADVGAQKWPMPQTEKGKRTGEMEVPEYLAPAGKS